MPKHVVYCMGCGVRLELAAYYKEPKCKPCRRKVVERKWSLSVKQLRVQAKRYRLLMHELGWKDERFDANLALLRERRKQAAA